MICLQYTAIATERHKPGAVVVGVVGVVVGVVVTVVGVVVVAVSVVVVVVGVVVVVETLTEINKHIIRDITPVTFAKLILVQVFQSV